MALDSAATCDSFVARADMSPVASCEKPAGHDGNHYAHIALLDPGRNIVDVDMEW